MQTTERYLGTKQDLVHAPNDGIRLRVAVLRNDDLATEKGHNGSTNSVLQRYPTFLAYSASSVLERRLSLAQSRFL